MTIDMKFRAKIKDIRKATDYNKLVIFVGAGVSNNSQIPTWSGLIRRFAKKLGYNNCKKCSFRNEHCPSLDCNNIYNFAQDEYLKIPQYFYNIDNSENKSEYFNIINESLNIEAKPNPIHDIIMKLYPKHIITTNYDRLIESTQSPHSMMYKVIIQDKDLLTQVSNNYIIKMHGDINNPETIILKESDYLNYQQNHILIETFIKSLLIDHTFLFIGYSLNDYNLKLIINWIEYLAKQHDVKESRPENFIILYSTEPIDKYYEEYFLSNNIFIINTFDLPEKLRENSLSVELSDKGRDVYAVLEYILDENNDYLIEPLKEVLFYKYTVFKKQNRISFQDLMEVHSFGNIEHLGELLFFYDKEKFNSLKEIIESNDEKANFIKITLTKAGIKAIQQDSTFISISDKIQMQECIFEEFIKLEQANKFLEIIAKLDDIDDEMVKAYYYYVICPDLANAYLLMEQAEQTMYCHNDYFKLLLFKHNMACLRQMNFDRSKNEMQDFKAILRNLPKSSKANCEYMERLYNGNHDNILKCIKLYNKHEEIYTKSTDSITFSSVYDYNFLKLQAISYDYYYYFKMNHLMLDHFTNPKRFLESYVKSMLCTYTPKKQRERNSFFGYEVPLKEYILNSTDLDIIIKYTSIKNLKDAVSKFSVKRIEFKEDVDLVGKFVNLCKSINVVANRFNYDYINNYLYILTKCSLTNVELNTIITTLNNLAFQNTDRGKSVLFHVFDELINFMNYYKDEKIDGFTNVLDNFLEEETISYIEQHYSNKLLKVYNILSSYSNTVIEEKVANLISNVEEISEKMKRIYFLHPLFTNDQKTEYMGIAKDNIDKISISYLFNYLAKNYLEYNEMIEDRFYDHLQKHIEKRRMEPSKRSFPDQIATTLEYLIILHLAGVVKSLRKFSCFSEYSDQLDFLLDPENFDYSKIKTDNYMWVNIMRNKEYLDVLKKHDNTIVLNLKKAILNGYATEEQKIMLYRYFLSDEEIHEYF